MINIKYFKIIFVMAGLLLFISGCFFDVQEYKISITDYPEFLTEGDEFDIALEIKTEKIISEINNLDLKLKVRESGTDKVLILEEKTIDNRSQNIEFENLIISEINSQLYIEIELYAGSEIISENKENLKVINPANWHTNIITTYFDIDTAEEESRANEDSEDKDYPAITSWGENKDEINNYYFALPYRPYISFYHGAVFQNQTDIKNRWIEIFCIDTGNTVYAQWEDIGPWNVYDPFYVFGNNDERPYAELGIDMGWTSKLSIEGGKARETNGAGLDISPEAMELLAPGQGKILVNWRFVEESDVLNGKWKNNITRSQSRTFNYRTRSLKYY